MTIPRYSLVSVNVGAVRTVEWRGDFVETAIWKYPVAGAVAVRGVNLIGDDQADRTVHGGRDKALYAYAEEDYEYWREEGLAIEPAMFGDNLTVRGVDLRSVLVGERWRVGSALLEVAQPRLPCYKLGIRMGNPRFLRSFLVSGRLGAYFRIIEEGEVSAGDAIDVVVRPEHHVTLGAMAEALEDRSKAPGLLAAGTALPGSWRRMGEGRE
jgi:MOSC domain-containing protein YiiM